MTQRGPSYTYRSAYCWAVVLIGHLLATVVDRCQRSAVLVLAISLMLIPVAGTQTAVTRASPSSANSNSPQGAAVAPLPASPDVQAIPLPKIADQAEELDRLLRGISGEMPTTSELLDTQRLAETHAEEIRQRELEAAALLAGVPTALEIEDEQRYWRSRGYAYAELRKVLTERAARLEEQIRLLDAQLLRWQATLEQIQDKQGIDALIGRTHQKLDAIQTCRATAQEQLNQVLTSHNRVSEMDQQISDMRAQLRAARDRSRSRLLELESRPLWEIRALHELYQSAGPAVRQPFDRSFTATVEFLRVHKLGIFLLLASYVLAVLAAFQLKRRFERGSWTDVPPEALRVLASPFSAALAIALVGTGTYVVASAPMGIALTFYLLYLIPVLRLLAPLTEPGLRTLIYVLALFYTLAGLFLLIQWPALLRREFFTIIVLAALLSFGWLARPSRIRQLSVCGQNLRVLTIGIRVGLVLLAASLAANIIGFVSLAQLLGLAALLGAFLAAALYCGVRVLALALTLILLGDWARRLPEMRADTIQWWGNRALALGASLLWLGAMLQLFTIYDNVMEAVSKTLQRPIGFERLQITLGGVLSFFTILLLGYALAVAVTFALRTVLLAKFPSHRGLPVAISQLTYYLLLVLIFLAALTNAGIDLNRFTVITGALGVGVGFGLQNIVNNFVSGLVLLLERPIHDGDLVEVGGVTGTVRHIGVRSSTVLTAQGAEVIVPNSNLLSNQVINWTVGSPRRRVEVNVGVAYGTDIERVLQMLVQVAESHPGVLRELPPAAFFLGFGESALNFELRFWSAELETWFQLRSEVATAIAKALHEANIVIPFPQRDLNVRRVGASVQETLARNAEPTTPSAVAPKSERSRVTVPPSPSEE